MRKIITAALAILIIAGSAVAAEESKTEEQKTLYAVGLLVARQLSVFNLSPADFEIVKQGLADGMAGKTPLVDLDAYIKKTQELAVARRDAQGAKLVARTKEFVDKAAAEPGAVKTASGLVYRSLRDGTGASPTPTDMVRAHYRGAFIDGKEFDNSYKRNEPVEFKLLGSLKCWTEGVQRMKAGGKARLVCPPEIAYGKTGHGIIPADATLVYEIELLEVLK